MLRTGRRIAGGLMAVVFMVSFALPASAQQPTLDDVLKRLDAVEKENAELRAEVNAMKSAQADQSARLDKATTVVASAAGATSPSGNFLKTKFDVDLYGFVKADLIWANNEANTRASVSNGAAITYNAPLDSVKKKQGTFNASAQDTRIGLNLKPAPLPDGGQITGKIEFDFANSAVTNSTSGTCTPRLRLANVKLDYAKWGVTAGQDWDFFSPVNTNLLNSGNAWRAGNVGYRHPQAYVTNKWGEFLGGKWSTRIGVIDTDDWSQENSNVPVAGVYLQDDTKILGAATTLGVGGVFGTSTTDSATSASVTTGSEGNKTNDIYAVVLNGTVKFTDWLSLKAKGYQGAKLDKFQVNNAIGWTNVNYDATTKSLRSFGGFTELSYNPIKTIETNFGLGYDGLLTPKDDLTNYVTSATVSTDNPWISNETYWTNLKYSLSKDILIGLEYQHFDTHFVYNHLKAADDRVESSFILKF